MTKIAVVENQYTHFDKIHMHLENNGFKVFPANDSEQASFKEFIDLVRVFLNERYADGITPGSKRTKALNQIVSILQNEAASLILIDYVLVGYHDSLKGTFLASELRKKGIKIPVIFLSRTEPNSLETMTSYHQVAEPKGWIHKGYAGRRILEKTFFKDEVITKINELLKPPDASDHKQGINNLSVRPDFSNYETKILRLRSTAAVRNFEDHRRARIYHWIDAILGTRNVTEEEINAVDVFQSSSKNKNDFEALLEVVSKYDNFQ